MKLFNKLKYENDIFVILTKTISFPNGVTINEGTEVKIVERHIIFKTYDIVYNAEVYSNIPEEYLIPSESEFRYIK